MPAGSLTIVGTGIKVAAHVTVEARAWIEQAERVFYLTGEQVGAEWIRQLNPAAEDLASLYARGKRRLDTYGEMVERVLAAVREGQRVCAAFYGHPGIFVFPAHEALRRAHEEGFPAAMLPGVSAEDCLFADLGIDPAREGCQSYEATDFLIRPRRFDTSTGLVLWQIGVVGNLSPPEREKASPGLAVLVEVLEAHYGAGHEVVIYEAARYPGDGPAVQCVPLGGVPDARVTSISTMYVPPLAQAALDAEMMARLGLSVEAMRWEGK
jgi:uncharacterized protein YabN with tetrapyrrole methylase and pyrophosphatase domain